VKSLKFKVKSLGFTLIELMIVVAFITLIGVMAVPNIKSYGTNQKLKNAALQLQLDIRTAQNNASSGLKCGALEDKTALEWRTIFGTDTTTYQVLALCIDNSTESTVTKTIPGGVTIKQIDFYADTIQCTPSQNAGKMIKFANISSKVDFEGVPAGCNPKSMVITLQTSGSSDVMQVVVEKGGSIYVK
jgi:Tfp pilus assembly protein FimT